MATQEKTWNVANRLHSLKDSDNPEVNHIITGADEIYDDAKEMKQSEHNTQTDDRLNEVETDLNAPTEGIKDRMHTLEEQVAFEGDIEVENTPQGIISGSGKVTSANAVRGAIDVRTGYFVCESGASTAAKVINAPGFVLTSGGSIKVLMQIENTADNATLNINSTGAKALYYAGERASANNSWEAGETVEVYYDGTSYYANNVAGGSGSGDGVFDVSAKYPTSGIDGGNTYTLNGALAVLNANLSASKKKGGMSIKFIQTNPAKYTVVKAEGATEQPTGTEIQSDPEIISGTYTAGELSAFDTLPATLNSSLTYYLAVVETINEQEVTTYTTWVITYVQSSDNKYVQYRYIETDATTAATFTNVANWQGVDEIPIQGSKNFVRSGGVASTLGYTIESPEWLRVITDSENKIICGIKADGSIEWSVGVPTPIKKYIENKIVELSLDEYEDIVNFLNDLIGENKPTLVELLNNKVNVEEGKSLINAEYATGINYIENLEFAAVYTTYDKKILFGVKGNGDFYFGYGVPNQIVEYVNSQKAELQAEIQAENTRATNAENALGIFEDNPEYIKVVIDNVKKVLEGIKNDGTKYIGGDLRVDGDIINNGSTIREQFNSVSESVNDLQESVSGIESRLDEGTVIQRKDVSLISSIDFTYNYFLTSTGYALADSSYKCTGYISVKEGSAYSYNGSLTGGACIVAYNINKKVIYAWTSSSSISTLTMPAGTRFIRISSTNTSVTLKPTTDISIYSFDDALNYKVNGINSNIVTNNNEITISNNDLKERKLHLKCWFKFKGYVESTGDKPICRIIGQDDTLVLGVSGNGNSLLSFTDAEGLTTVCPAPKRNTKYYSKLGDNEKTATAELSLPRYREVIGQDLFKLQYIGAAAEHDYDIDNADVQAEYASLADKMHLSLVNNVLRVYVDNTDYINLNISTYSTVGALVDYINANYTDFRATLLVDSSTETTEIAPITDVVLVSVYRKIMQSNPATRYDSFPCYFAAKVDNSIHTVELLSNYGFVTAVIDGLEIMTAPAWVANIHSIVLGSNDELVPVEMKKWELSIGTFDEAELCSTINDSTILDVNIISEMNPNIVVIESHGIYEGDSCQGKTPIYMDETPTERQSAVISVAYRSIYSQYRVATSVCTSTHTLDSVAAYAKERGYAYVSLSEIEKYYNGGKLPKRCYTMIFDDENQYFFDVLSIRNIFSKYCANPVLATQFSISSIESADYIKKHTHIRNAKWDIVMHGVDGKNVGALSSTELYDTTSTNAVNSYAFNVQKLAAENAYIDWTKWVYSNGSTTPAHIKGFEHLGVKMAFNIGLHLRLCRGLNKINLSRVVLDEVHTSRNCFSYLK